MKIAVVIPALDEAHHIPDAVESARAQGVAIVVVDGGSRDATVARAREAGAQVIVGPAGRARQLQRGVEATSGDAVLFLHADTCLAAGWERAVARVLEDPRVAGGAFRLRFDGESVGLRVLEWGVRLRVALLALPYGDQAIFVRRSVLDAIGGVPEAAVMEDLDLVKGMRSQGRVVALPLPVTTSARRYRRDGALRTVVRHLVAALAWRAGVDRDRVAAWVNR